MDAIDQKIPKVSVYINTRNRANLIGRALDSLQKQTFEDFEVLVLDAGSTDNTQAVIENYIKKDNRIKYYKYGNVKIATCLNYVISQARGEYITHLDDDDEYLPEKINKQVKLLDSSSQKVGVVYCWEEFWDDKLNTKLYDNKPSIRGDAYLQLLETSCVGGGTTMMFRKSSFDFIKGFDETIECGGDYQFNLNISKHFHHDFVPEVLVRTHYNHAYNRLSEMKIPTLSYKGSIETVLKILTDHKDAYDTHPDLRFNQYRSIMHNAAKIKDYATFAKYLKYGLTIRKPMKEKTLYLIRGFKHLVFTK